jgi:hypothetical protein
MRSTTRAWVSASGGMIGRVGLAAKGASAAAAKE